MRPSYEQLLDAAIQHLQDLKAQGVRYVNVSPETLQALALPPRRVPQTCSHSSQLQSNSPQPVRHPDVVTRTSHAPAVSVAPASPLPVELSLPIVVPSDERYVSSAPLSPEAKAAAFAELRQRAMACSKCQHLAASRKNVVFGVGNINAELMFVGEAPGNDEDEQGEPFVGKAGQLLTKIIQAMGLQRGDVYIGNILKCRPDTPGQAAGNRKPTSEEMQTCISYLRQQIELIRPRVIVALGATAVEGLLGKPVSITKLRGQWQNFHGIPLMPTYHPAYLLRNQALSEKRKVWEDMLAVMQKLGLPISEKQRKYFLKPT